MIKITNSVSTPARNVSIYGIVVFFVIFPYLQFVPIGSDTQPYALLFSILYLMMIRSIQIELLHTLLIIPLGAAIALLMIEHNVAALRGFYGYLSIIVMFVVGYNGYLRNGPPKYKFLRNCLLVLIFVGLLQLFVDPNITSFLTSRDFGYGGRGGRGVESLTSEPTFLGFLCLMFLVFPIMFDEYSVKEKRNLSLAILILMVMISRSSSALVTLAVTLLIAGSLISASYFFNIKKSINLKLVTLAAILMFAAGALISTATQDNASLRVFSLIQKLAVSPMNVITSDPSLNDRFAHILVSLESIKFGYGLPFGFSTWNDYLFERVRHFAFINNVGGADGRVMSFIGSGIYEIGVFSAPIYLCLLLPIISQKRSIKNISILAGATILLIQSVPTGLPTAPFVLGMIAAKHRTLKLHTSVEKK